MKLAVLFLLCAAAASAASPAKCYAVASGNWNDPTIWAASSGGTHAGNPCTADGGAAITHYPGVSPTAIAATVPGASGKQDVAEINTGITVHVPAGTNVDLGSTTFGTSPDNSINVKATNQTTYGSLVIDNGGLVNLHGSGTTREFGQIDQYAVLQVMPGGTLWFGSTTGGPNFYVKGRLYTGCLDQAAYPTPFCTGNAGAWVTASVAGTLNITAAAALPSGLAVSDLVELNMPQTPTGVPYPYNTADDTTAPPAPPVMPTTTDTGAGKTCGSVAACVVQESTPLCVVAISGLSVTLGWPLGGTSAVPYCTGSETAIAITAAGSGNLWLNKPAFVWRDPSLFIWSRAVTYAPSSEVQRFDPTRSALLVNNIISNVAGDGPGRLGDSSLSVASNNWHGNNTSTGATAPCAFLSIADVTSNGCYMDQDRGVLFAYGFAVSFTGSMSYTTVGCASSCSAGLAAIYVPGSITPPDATVRQYNAMVFGNTDFRNLMKDTGGSFISFKVLDNSTNRQAGFLFNSVRMCEGLVGVGSIASPTVGFVAASSSTPLQINSNSIFRSSVGLNDSGIVGLGNINFWSDSDYWDFSNNYIRAVYAEVIGKLNSVVNHSTFSHGTITNNNVIDDTLFLGQASGSPSSLYPGLLFADNRITGTGSDQASSYVLAVGNIANNDAGNQALFTRNIIYGSFRPLLMTSGTTYSRNYFVYHWHHTAAVTTQGVYGGGVVSRNIFHHNVLATGNAGQGVRGLDMGWASSLLVDGITAYNNTWLGHALCVTLGDRDIYVGLLMNIQVYDNICAPDVSPTDPLTGGFALGKGNEVPNGGGGATTSSQQLQMSFVAYNAVQGTHAVYQSENPAALNANNEYNRDIVPISTNGINYNTDPARNIPGISLQNSLYSNTTAATGKVRLVRTSSSDMTLEWSTDNGASYGTPVQLNWTTAGTKYTLSVNATAGGAISDYFSVTKSAGTAWTKYIPAVDASPMPAGCPGRRWALFDLINGGAANVAYGVMQCTSTTVITMTPYVVATVPVSGDTFAVIKSEVRLFDAGGVNYVDVGIDARLLPAAAATYTDGNIALVIQDYCSPSGCAMGGLISGLPTTFTTGVSGVPLSAEPLPMYGGSAQHAFTNPLYEPGGNGWKRASSTGSYVGAIAPSSTPATPGGIIP